MTRGEFMALLRPLDEATSEDHGGHEGGYPGNCAYCAILGLIETIGFLAGEVEWEAELEAQDAQ